jgi:hypothetical protein
MLLGRRQGRTFADHERVGNVHGAQHGCGPPAFALVAGKIDGGAIALVRLVSKQCEST